MSDTQSGAQGTTAPLAAPGLPKGYPGLRVDAATPTGHVSAQRPAARERHVRTFRRIVAMMAVALAMRAPSWAVSVYLFNTRAEYESQAPLWRLKFSFSLLSVLSSALNPLLYCFPDASLAALKWLFSCCTTQSNDNPTPTSRQTKMVADVGPRLPQAPFQPRGPCGDARLSPLVSR